MFRIFRISSYRCVISSEERLHVTDEVAPVGDVHVSWDLDSVERQILHDKSHRSRPALIEVFHEQLDKVNRRQLVEIGQGQGNNRPEGIGSRDLRVKKLKTDGRC